MRVLCYRHESGVHNFGDELNLWLWDKLLPQAGSVLRPDLIFLGIGTLLNNKLPPGPKLVFGAGAGYGPPPKLDSSWDIRFVRGRDTAAALGLDPSKALMDPGAAVGLLLTPLHVRDAPALIPRFDSVTPMLSSRCRRAGVQLIDPRNSVDRILPQVASSSLLLAEALHGAIVADALRVPWIPILTDARNVVHGFKWWDWLSMLGLDYNPISLTLHELDEVVTFPGQLSDPRKLKALVLRFISELQQLRTEINERRGPFAVDKEARA